MGLYFVPDFYAGNLYKDPNPVPDPAENEEIQIDIDNPQVDLHGDITAAHQVVDEILENGNNHLSPEIGKGHEDEDNSVEIINPDEE